MDQQRLAENPPGRTFGHTRDKSCSERTKARRSRRPAPESVQPFRSRIAADPVRPLLLHSLAGSVSTSPLVPSRNSRTTKLRFKSVNRCERKIVSSYKPDSTLPLTPLERKPATTVTEETTLKSLDLELHYPLSRTRTTFSRDPVLPRNLTPSL